MEITADVCKKIRVMGGHFPPPPEVFVEFAQAWLDHEQQVGGLEKLMHDLTPMGSEFVGRPEKCAEWIRHHETKLTAMLVSAKGENREFEAQVMRYKVIIRDIERWAAYYILSGSLPDYTELERITMMKDG